MFLSSVLSLYVLSKVYYFVFWVQGSILPINELFNFQACFLSSVLSLYVLSKVLFCVLGAWWELPKYGHRVELFNF